MKILTSKINHIIDYMGVYCQILHLVEFYIY